MVVEHNRARGIFFKSEAKDVAGRDGGRSESPDIDLALADDPMMRVEVDGTEPLLHVVRIAADESRCKRRRLAHRLLASIAEPCDAPSQLERRANAGHACRAEVADSF